MFSAIQNEVNKLKDNSSVLEPNNSSELEDAFVKLQEVKIDLENLDTNEHGNDSITNEEFDKLKELVLTGNSLLEAYRNILPASLLEHVKDTISYYEEELTANIVHSDSADDYRAGLTYIINNLSTIYNGEEISFKELKNIFDNKYN